MSCTTQILVLSVSVKGEGEDFVCYVFTLVDICVSISLGLQDQVCKFS